LRRSELEADLDTQEDGENIKALNGRADLWKL